MKGCHMIIRQNNDSPQALRVILGVLCDRSTLAAQEQAKNPNSLMFHVELFGELAKSFKTELLDPVDKIPSVTKTVNRMLEIIFTFLKERSQHVLDGCARTLVIIFENCYPDKADPGPDGIVNIFVTPLLKLL